MSTVNALILIHGMILDPTPRDHTAQYDRLIDQLSTQQPNLRSRLAPIIRVEWGHGLPTPLPTGPSPDQQLTAAENTLNARISYAVVQADRSPANHLLTGFFSEPFSTTLGRRLTTPIKEVVMIRGITDALYYCAPDGERAIRKTVYTQVLASLDAYRNADTVRLHVIAHSLGATVAFDFLYGLFAPNSAYPNGTPDFVRENMEVPEVQAVAAAYQFWRERAQQQRLRLGSLSSTGGQVPLLLLRKQKLVDALARGEQLDATVIGIQRSGPVQWKNFYDVDDVLGFPTRRVFVTDGEIEDHQVDTGWLPEPAHTTYWQHVTVIREISDLIRRNLGSP